MGYSDLKIVVGFGRSVFGVFCGDAGRVAHVHVVGFVRATYSEFVVGTVDVSLVGVSALGVRLVGVRIVEFLGRRGGVGDAVRGRERSEGIVDRDPEAVEKVAETLVMFVEFVDRDLHHLDPAVIVEIEVGLDMGYLAGFGLGEALFERLGVGVYRGVEQPVEMVFSLVGAVGVGLVHEHRGMKLHEPVVYAVADDGRRERLFRREMADCLFEFHTDSTGASHINTLPPVGRPDGNPHYPRRRRRPMPPSYAIIGDGIAGSSAAETIREGDPDADITVITDEGEALYNRILIKEFAKGKLPAAPMSIHSPEWYDERDIDLRLDTLVTDIDTAGHILQTHTGDEIGYDKLLIATGGTPTQLPVENSDAEGIHHFWTFEDARDIADHAEAAETGVIVGAGLLGIDFAAICGAQEIEANYLMRGGCWWRYALSKDGGEIIHRALEEKGVTPVFESGVDHFEIDDSDHVTAAVTPDGETYDADFVGIAIGLDFNLEVLHDTDIERDEGIVVDEYMQTSVEDVYAAGDLTRFYDTLLGEYAQNGSWGSAKEQGSIAGQNMLADGEEAEFRWVSSYSITHFDFPFLSFGHPTLGDDSVEAKFGDEEWRRLALKDGKIVGGVLIGNLAPQTKYKKLIREERDVTDCLDLLMEEQVDLDKLVAAAGQ